MGRRWYQNVDVEGLRFEDPDRKRSRFWNEGKWNHFIAPLLPKERGTFVEIGCNAGLFLKMAREAGFGNVIGVEGNPRIMAQAKVFKKHVGGDWKLVQRRVGVDFALDELPLADVVLISNTHYYLPVGTLSNLADRLKSRALCCIVVAGKARRFSGCAFYDLGSVRGYFRGWRETGMVEGLDTEGDPAPRREMYGVSYKGSLDARNVGNAWSKYRRWAMSSSKFKRHALPPALEEFFGKVLSGGEFDPKGTLLYEYWERLNYGSGAILAKLERKKKLAESVRAEGLKEPIYYDSYGKLLDGIHRLAIVRELGHEHVLVRLL